METNIYKEENVLDFSLITNYSANKINSKKIFEKKSGNITLFAFDKEQNLSRNSVPYDTFVQVIEGVCEIEVNNKSHLLTDGMSIVLPANIPYNINSISKFKMLLTIIGEAA